MFVLFRFFRFLCSEGIAAAVTTRGLKEDDMDMIAECIALVLQSEDNIEKVKGMVAELTAKYPLDM